MDERVVTDTDLTPLPDQPRTPALRKLYAEAMHLEQRRLTEEDISGDRFDLHAELSLQRQFLALLLKAEAKTRDKFPDREDILIALKTQQVGVSGDIIRSAKVVREVENAGNVFTADKIAALLDKVASIVMYRVRDLADRSAVLDDITDLMTQFRRSFERGTLVTPDQDAKMMDATVPDPKLLEGS